ncbi:MAG: alanine racemase [Planctomycetota bacterium]|jgi:alanine racemase
MNPEPRHERIWAEVDLDRIARNLAVLTEAAGGVRVMAVLKADGYGLGAVPIARRLLAEGVAIIGVGDSTEAIELREAGIVEPILVLGAIAPGEAEKIVAYDIATCVHSSARAELLNEEAERQGRHARVHLMVDTGMGRLGVTAPKAPELAATIAGLPCLRLEGLATHYASAASPITLQLESQFHMFREVVGRIREDGIDPGVVHASCSASLFSPLTEHFDMVRLGIGLLGINPGNLDDADRLEPALSLHTQIIFMKDFPPGSPIGYHGTYTTRTSTRIATLPIGYNDGLSWQLSNRARVLVRGQWAPIVGAISMDYTTIDVGHVKDASVGDVVTVIGRDGGEEIRVEDLANAGRTIPYEVTCRLSRRVVRIYRGATGTPR